MSLPSKIVALLGAVAVLAIHALPATAQELRTKPAGSWTGGASTDVRCPAPTLLVGLRARLDQWIHGVSPICRAASATGSWAGDEVVQPQYGATHGSFLNTYRCPTNMFVGAYAAQLVRWLDNDNIYVADVRLQCINLRSGATDHVGAGLGAGFAVETDYAVMGDSVIDGDYGCTSGWAANAITVRSREDGLDRFGLVCESRTQYANFAIPRFPRDGYVPQPPPVAALPSTPSYGEWMLACGGDSKLKMVGWSVDAGTRGVRRIETICAPTTGGGNWQASQKLPVERLDLPNFDPAVQMRTYLCPTNMIVGGVVVYGGTGEAAKDLAPQCIVPPATGTASLVHLPASGVETRVRFASEWSGCTIYGQGAALRVSSTSADGSAGIREASADCYGVLLAGDPPGPCLKEPARCSSTPFDGRKIAVTRVAPQAPPPPAAVPAAPKAAPAPTGPTCVVQGAVIIVRADVMWCDTGIKISRGQRISIVAQGRWSNSGPPSKGPEGFAGYKFPGTIVANADLASLVARIGETTIPIRAGFEGVADGEGILFLSINDTADSFLDNQGYVEVRVRVG